MILNKHTFLLILGLFLIAFPQFLSAQCPGLSRDTMAFMDLENGLATGWRAGKPSDGGEWKLDGGKIGYFSNPGSGNWLYLDDEEGDDIGRAEFYSPDFDLSAFNGQVFFEFDLLFEAFEDSSFFRLEVWDGKNWIEFLYLREDFSGRLQVDLTGIEHEAVQLKFTFDDEGAWAWGMGVDNLLLYGIPVSCGNGICDPGENPNDCPEDCESLAFPAPFWVEPGTDLGGNPVNYLAFNFQSNCDDCSQLVPLGFTFSFFDTDYDQVYINSNGNLTFENDFVEYTPSPFCLDGPRMIAPFFGDVDITHGGEISFYADPDRHYFIVHWEGVSYFGCEPSCGLTNTFQVILTDGSMQSIKGQLLPPQTNVIFSYADMQWTTGGSSGGVNGFGGSAATVGLNLGDEVICMDYGTFDSEGFGYRGNGQEMNCLPNEVSHLDFRSLAWDGENGQVLKEEDIPPTNSIRLKGVLGTQQNQVRWQLEDTTYTKEFIMLRGESKEDLYEILRASISEAFQADSQFFELTDYQPLEGHNHYQIKEVLANGEENPSEILLLNHWESDPQEEEGFKLVSLGPNPFKNYLNLVVDNPGLGPIDYLMTNQMGQVVLKGQWQESNGTIRLDLPDVPKGKYFLSLIHAQGREGRKLIRN